MKAGRSFIAFALFALTILPLSAETPGDIFTASGIRRGLFVLMDDDAGLAVELATAEPVLVFVIAPEEKVDSIRAQIVGNGLHGRITVSSQERGRLPLIDNLAAVVVAYENPKPDRTELMRILRPLGQLCIGSGGKWAVTEKPRPEGMDDWPQYFHDAAMTDLSGDLLAGPAQGIQWLAGDNSIQPAKLSVRVVGSLVVHVDERGVVARDAYSGLPIWRRSDLKPPDYLRYAFLADEQRLYLVPYTGDRNAMPSHMVSLDLQTGEDAQMFSQGVSLGWVCAGISPEANKQLERTDRKQASSNRGKAEESYRNVQARLAGGVLLQTLYGEMIAVDASTGKRLWTKTLTGKSEVHDPRRGTRRMENHVWNHPMILDGLVYAVEGEPAQSWSYTHWPMGVVRAIHCYDLKSGDDQWVWRWPESRGEAPAAYNMTPAGEYLGLMLRTRVSEKSPTAFLFVKRDGTSHKYLDDTPYNGGWGKGIGGGHSHARILFVNGKVWINGTTRPIGAIDLDGSGDKAQWNMKYAKLPRPVGCTVTRATPNYVFGSLTTYSLSEDAIQHTSAARAVCDVGAIPAGGMTFISPTQCFCAPYLPGFKAFHPRPFAGMEKMIRLEKGVAAPAPKTTAASDWPMYMANARRGNWTGAKLPANLGPLWTIRPVEEKNDDPIVAEWRDNWYTQGPVTPVSIAEGVAVFALVDAQQVIAMKPSDGKVLWRSTVDGRVDTSPTIRDGLVYVGTRNGWVYALNRDTGKLAWRFLAAPRRDRMLAFGQLESRWPLHGSVLVDDDGVWAIAGRHNDTDAGLWWWRLDPVTGKPRASGRLGSDGLSTEVGVGRRSDGRQSGANTPIVSDGRLMLLAGIHLEKRDGQLTDRPMKRGAGSTGEHAWWADNFNYDILIPGNQGLVFDYTQMGGYKMPYFGFTQAPVYAYKGKNFLHAGGTTTEQHRGGGRGGRRTEVTRFRKLDEIREVPHPKQENRKMKVGSDTIWKAPYHESDGRGLGGLAVAGDAVLVGFSVENRDHWRARDEMAHRLRVFDYETGKKRQDDLALPAKPVLHGVSAGDGRVFVVCEDGTVVCMGAKP
ncbi:MAG: PQQ-binding-like beta-propeller repeat protein [Kiritimatiellia bacterium]|nr:PQQ-binding-like beta-propeller repeat protein [Kiritimatiellia bacterium]